MAATSRFILFDSDAETSYLASGTNAIQGAGSRIGYAESFYIPDANITLDSSANQMGVSLNDGSFQTLVLTPGTNLDARTIARDISWKLHSVADPLFEHAQCEFINGKFRIYSATAQGSKVNVQHPSNSCLHLLGMSASQGGAIEIVPQYGASNSDFANYVGGNIQISGYHTGQFDDIITVMIGTQHPVGEAVVVGSYPGAVVTAGDWNEVNSETYTITIDTSSGTTMNAGKGNCPKMSWASTQGDPSVTPVELLYSDYFYEVGTRGLLVKFSDSPFGSGDTITITCTKIDYAEGSNSTAAVGAAKFVWSSRKHGKSSSAVTTSTVGSAITKGLTIAFSDTGTLTARDEMRIACIGPNPTSPAGVTTLNYGSVTVSTYSPTRSIWFELVSGAKVLSTPRFGLLSHGTAQHHQAGNQDTLFAFGTAGKGNPGSDGSEWKKGITGADLDSSTSPPAYLYAVEENLPVVSTAEDSESVGVADGEMISDFIHLAVKLGANETGVNSTIVYRMFYDFS